MTMQTKLTPEQRRIVDALNCQAWAVRGLQIFIVGLAVYLTVFDGRGWPAFIIGLLLAVWLQTQLPALPSWAEELRKKNK